MHPLLYVAGAFALWQLLKNKTAVAANSSPSTPVLLPGNVSVDANGVVIPGTPVATAGPNPSTVPDDPMTVTTDPSTYTAPAFYPPAGTILGYGAGGRANIADGAGGITVGGVPKAAPIGSFFDLVVGNSVIVWQHLPDGTFAAAGPAPFGVTTSRGKYMTYEEAFSPPVQALQGYRGYRYYGGRR